MYDSAKAESWDIDVTLEETTGPRYILTYTASEEWLTDPERVYPVIIDPVVELPTHQDYIEDTFVSSANPTKNYHDWQILRTGYSTAGVRRTLIRFTDIPAYPALGAADEIISAQLHLYQNSGLSQSVAVNIHQITEPWDFEGVNWNNQPAYNSRIYDYEIASGIKWRTFNVTSVVKHWYDGESNHGFMIKHNNELDPVFDFDSSRAGSKPWLEITYRNQSGLEGYLSYTSMGLGRSGGAHINNYNGNLVYTHTDLSLSGNRLPLHLSHIYNSGAKDTDIGFGNGWQLNLSQSVTEETLGGIEYAVYTDGDGTIHWYKLKDSIYESPPGMYLTLEKDEVDPATSFIVSDNKDNKLKFDQSGQLYEIEDNQGDKTVIEFEYDRISIVTDGSGRKAVLEYLNGLLSKITDPVGRETIFAYEQGNLIGITYPDSLQTVITYADTDTLITGVTHPAGQSLAISYLGNGNVGNITHISSDELPGQSLSFHYNKNTTAVTDRNGRVTRYNFNHAGNPVNIIDPMDNAVHLRWEDNNLTRQMAPKNTTVNFLWNHRFDQETGWSFLNESSSQAENGYVTNQVHLGAKSYRINKTNTLGQSFIKQDVELAPGTYTLSAYVKTSGVSSNSGKGAYIFVRDSQGVLIERSSYVSGSKDWQRLYLSFDLPQGFAGNITVGLGIEGETGEAWFDSAQLEEGLVATSYNLVENSIFARPDGTNPLMPWSWELSDFQVLEAGDGLVSGVSKFGDQSFRFEGNTDVYKNLRQHINLSGQQGDPYIISGWAKARAVPKVAENDEERQYRTGALAIGFLNTHSGKYSWRYLDINEDYEGWQFISGVIEAPYDYEQVTVYVVYHNNANEIYFDGVQLFKEPVTSYTYDANGNIVSVNNPNNQSTNYIFNENNDMIGMIDAKGGEYSFAQDNRHNVLSAVSPAGVAYSFSYDDNGNLATASQGQLASENLLTDGDIQSGHFYFWKSATDNNTGYVGSETDYLSDHNNTILGLYSHPASDNHQLSAWQEAEVKPNTIYTLSARVFTQLQYSEAWYEIEELDSGGKVVNVISDRYAAYTGYTFWTSRALTFTTGNETVKVRVHLKTGKGEIHPEQEQEPEPDYTETEIAPAKDAATSSTSTTNYGSAQWLGVGQTPNGTNYRTAIGFDLPVEAQGKKIVEAKLYLHTRYVSVVSDQETTVEIRDALEGWNEYELNKDIFPAYNHQPAVTWNVPAQSQETDGAENIVDITAIVQRWADGYNRSELGHRHQPDGHLK